MSLFNWGNKKGAAKSASDDLSYAEEARQWFQLTGGSRDYTSGDDFENAYGSISKIAQAGRIIEPFLRDDKGEAFYGEHDVTNVLYRPNQDMSDEEFREALILLYLTKPRYYVRVHHNGKRRANGTIDPKNITGLSFLENVTPYNNGGVIQYRTAKATYTEGEVMSLGGLNANALMTGYSPLMAARRWTRIEDYMSDHQAAYFKNGAVPAGMFVITAQSADVFKDIKKKMQAHTRGAKNNNNVLYSYKPADTPDGKPVDSQIQWIPFNVMNKDLALKDLHEIVQKKQNDAFGVSGVIKGDVDDTTYASAMVVEKLFVKYTLKPVVSAIWRRFSHELARVTGGFDYSISFELEIPVVGEELIQKAESTKTNVESFLLLADKYEQDSIIDALDLPAGFKKLVPIGSAKKKDTTEDSAEVQRTGEVKRNEVRQDDPRFHFTAKARASEYPNLHKSLGINKDELGCIMLDTEKLDVMSVVPENLHDQLADATDWDHGVVPAETVPHMTILFGLMENGNNWKKEVDTLLKGWMPKTITIKEVGFFENDEGYVVIGHVDKTEEIQEGHDRLTLLPHLNTFTDYNPHVTFAYLKKNADVKAWVEALAKEYNGAVLKSIGINYGDKPSKDKNTASKSIQAYLASKEVGLAITDEDVTRLGEIVREYTLQDFEDMALAFLNQNQLPDYNPIKNRQLYELLTNEASSILVIEGSATFDAILKDIDTDLLTNPDLVKYEVSEYLKKYYQGYFEKVAEKFNEQSREFVKKALENALVEGQNVEDLTKNLVDAGLVEYRAKRLAASEINRAKNNAQIDAHRRMSDNMLDYYYVKRWSADGAAPCPLCQSLHGSETHIDGSFLKADHSINGEDEKEYTNTYIDMVSADAHPWCECNLRFELRKY